MIHGLYWTRTIKQVGDSFLPLAASACERPACCQESLVSRKYKELVGQHLDVNSYTTAMFLCSYDTTFWKKFK